MCKNTGKYRQSSIGRIRIDNHLNSFKLGKAHLSWYRDFHSLITLAGDWAASCSPILLKCDQNITFWMISCWHVQGFMAAGHSSAVGKWLPMECTLTVLPYGEPHITSPYGTTNIYQYLVRQWQGKGKNTVGKGRRGWVKLNWESDAMGSGEVAGIQQ